MCCGFGLAPNLCADVLKEPLDVLPHVLPCTHDGAEELLALIGECGSPKEVVIAVQEASERLASALEQDECQDAGQLPFPLQLVRFLSLYASGNEVHSPPLSCECDVCQCFPAIPRLKLRRSASQTIQPIIPELEQLMSTIAASATVSQGRLLIVMASNLAKTLDGWAKVNVGDNVEEVSRCAVSLSLTSASIFTDDDCALCAGDANVLPGHHPRNVCEPDRQLDSPANIRGHLSAFRRPICSAWRLERGRSSSQLGFSRYFYFVCPVFHLRVP